MAIIKKAENKGFQKYALWFQQKKVVNVFIMTYIAVLTLLSARTFITEDLRFGWGMFGHRVEYKPYYTYILDDLSKIPIEDPPGIRGRKRSFLSQEWLAHWYGVGGMKAWLTNYSKYLSTQEMPDNAIGIATYAVYSTTDNPDKKYFGVTIMNP